MWGLKPPVDPAKLPRKFRPDSLSNRKPGMLGFRPGGSEDARGNLIGDPNNTIPRSDLTDVGNYNYGYVGAMHCISLDTLLRIGDYDQWLSGKQGCKWCKPKDRPRDAEMVREGYNNYRAENPCACQ